MDEARKLLVETKVKALGALTGSTLIQLLDTNTVEQALQVLAENHILSAPVLAPGDNDQGATWPSQLPDSDIMGFICVNDILTSFLDCYTSECGDASFGDGSAPQNGHPNHHSNHRQSQNGSAQRTSQAGNGPSMLARMRQLEALGLRFAQQQLCHLSCKGCDGDFLHSRRAGEATLLELVMYGFLDPKRRGMHEGEQQAEVVHRVALFDNSGTVTAVISQSDICRFLADHQDRLGELAAATVAELGWDRKPVVSCTPETPALDAMRLMVGEGVSALAVVSSAVHHPDIAAMEVDMAGATADLGEQAGVAAAAGAATAAGGTGNSCRRPLEVGSGAWTAAAGALGRLLGNFSASEMRTMTAEHFGALALPVGEFLALEHDTEYVAANRERLLEEGVVGSPAHAFIQSRLRRTRPHAPGEEVGQRLIVATPESTFGEVLTLLVQHRIHRVYVVDSNEAPVGIITCTDILRKVVEVATAPMSPATAKAQKVAGTRALREGSHALSPPPARAASAGTAIQVEEPRGGVR